MDDLGAKIESVLSSPDAMEKVKNIMQALSLGSDKPESATEPEEVSAALPEASADTDSFSSVLDAFSGLSDLSALSNLDPKLISGLFSLLGEYNRKDEKRDSLMRALKPYLRTERREKMERAAHLMKLARTARSGLSLFLGGNDDA